MSVHAASAASPPWQMLAELRASRANATDPTPVGTPSTASSGAVQPGDGSTATTTGIAPLAPGLLQFLQQFQSVYATGPSDSGTTGGTPQTLPGSQSLFTQLQQGTSSLGGSASASDGTQTGNDLALQFLGGLQGAALQSTGVGSLLALAG